MVGSSDDVADVVVGQLDDNSDVVVGFSLIVGVYLKGLSDGLVGSSHRSGIKSVVVESDDISDISDVTVCRDAISLAKVCIERRSVDRPISVNCSSKQRFCIE